jgi:polysaccharide biosynthesis protein PslH
MRILFLSPWLPYPATNGSKLRIFSLLRGLSKEHEIHLFSFIDADSHAEQCSLEMKRWCAEVTLVAAPQKYRPADFRSLLGLFSLQPRSITATFSSEIYQKIFKIVREKSFNVIIASELGTASYWTAFGDTPAVYEDLEVGLLTNHIQEASSSLKKLRQQLTLLKQRFYLGKLLNQFRAVTLVSDQELRLAQNLAPNHHRMFVVPNCIELSNYQVVQTEVIPGRLVFNGSFNYEVNYQAMVWFIEKAYPRITERCPQAHLVITGDHLNRPLPPGNHIIRTGQVDDVKPIIASATASVVPILYGGGTRLKILEAMALDTPVISTSKGAEGLDVLDGEHLLLADQPRAFAEAVIRVLSDSTLGRSLAANAKQLVQEKYDWEMVMPRFLEIVKSSSNSPLSS